MSKTEERKILEGIMAGDEAVIKAFYQKNLGYIRGYILQNSGNEADVEDVFQDALVLIYQKLTADSLEITASIHTYFYAVCKNMWRNRLRKNNKMVVKETLPDHEHALQEDITEDLEQQEREQVYRKYFVQLNDTCKRVLGLVFEGKNMKEISSITGYSEGYTRKKKFECKKSLIEMIEKDPIYKELKINSEN
ncbi:RNA polymerase sigma factor [Aquimarina sp. AU474]|uniref:RNA polymerase sigma factor n=1 Tax=Aquimarina sp. AU474 TaxID=2108529 RepID=UPI000D692FEE|nr:sigma-70 family RNA polymerase sigma factor [Aquimarina sp. AU474]